MAYKGFSQVELRKPKRSMFDMSHTKLVSGFIGQLIPIFIKETIPNDTWKVSSNVYLRLAPLIAPVFHRLTMYIHYFWVPNRLLYKDWETFITGGRLGEAVTVPPVPPAIKISDALAMESNLFGESSLADYLGIPNIDDADIAVWAADGGRYIHAMPFAACYKAWYDYYRDRNYEDDNAILPLASGNIVSNAIYGPLLSLRMRAWAHDYFTSALPFVQRGAEVLLPMEGSGSVNYKDITELYVDSGAAFPEDLSLLSAGVGAIDPVTGANKLQIKIAGDPVEPETAGQIRNIDDVDIDQSSVSINDLRVATALQSWLERNALAGSRYNESIYAHFARRTSDGRLQRSEYLGGGKAVVQISEVNTTAWSVDTASGYAVPPGDPVGRGSTYSESNSFSYNCEEHGFIVGYLSVLPDAIYMNGIPRMFTVRTSFLDYPWPAFAHLGEQDVFDNELLMNPTNMKKTDGTYPNFGYQSRYIDWKMEHSTVHGSFRNSLDFWHLGRKFDSTPALGQLFVYYQRFEDQRIWAAGNSVDTLWMYVRNQARVVRALPYFGTPQL